MKTDLRYDPYLKLFLDLPKHDGLTFMSDDAYGHLCTVSGATWGMQGRKFDRLDDNIKITHYSGIPLDVGTSDFAFLFWMNMPASTAEEFLIDKNTGGNNPGYFIRVNATGYLGLGISDGTITVLADTNYLLDDGNWHFVGVLFDRDGQASYYLDNNEPVNLGSISVRSGNADSPGHFYLGANDGTVSPYGGILAKVWMIKGRLPTRAEIQDLYLTTKWRHQ